MGLEDLSLVWKGLWGGAGGICSLCGVKEALDDTGEEEVLKTIAKMTERNN